MICKITNFNIISRATGLCTAGMDIDFVSHMNTLHTQNISFMIKNFSERTVFFFKGRDSFSKNSILTSFPKILY